MADITIGELPQASTFDRESLLVVENQGKAQKVTGGQVQDLAKAGAAAAAAAAAKSAEAAAKAANESEASKNAVLTMEVAVETLAPGSEAFAISDFVDGVYRILFGLPTGNTGPTGADGVSVTHAWSGTTLIISSAAGTSSADLKGEKGDTGAGFRVLGYYASVSALTAAVTDPAVGDAYGVGGAAPYDIYIWDGSEWVNNGHLQGAKGDKGDPGVGATHSWTGTTLTITSAAGTSSADLKGDKGDKGDDYVLTEEDKTDISGLVLAALPAWEGGSY